MGLKIEKLEITTPTLHFAYKIGNEKSGHVSFPLITPGDHAGRLWNAVVANKALGDLVVISNQSNSRAVIFRDCFAQKLKLECIAGDRVDFDLDFDYAQVERCAPFEKTNAIRVITWSDLFVETRSSLNDELISGVKLVKERNQKSQLEIDIHREPILEDVKSTDIKIRMGDFLLIDYGQLYADVTCKVVCY